MNTNDCNKSFGLSIDDIDDITSQRGSAWQCYIGRWLSKGKPAFFHLSAWKTNGNFKTIFGTGDDVGETYKHAKFG